jgi:hypothetical protein
LSNEDAVDQIRNNPTKINEVANNAMPNSTSTRPSLCALIQMLNINKAITILGNNFLVIVLPIVLPVKVV